MVYQLWQMLFAMHTYKLQPRRSTTLYVVLNPVLKILERKPSSQEPYMVENVLEETSGTILEAAWSSLDLSLPVLIQMCEYENPYKRIELLNTLSMYSCTQITV